MSTTTECTQNTDSLKLVREGTSQKQRLSPALDPAYAPVDERTHAHRMVFAQAYAQYLKYFGSDNAEAGDWQPFFSQDVSALLAVAAVQDVAYYRQSVKEYADFLNDRQNEHDKAGLRDHLDYLFSCCATLAIRIDLLKEKLPPEISLGKALQNLVQSQLAPALKRLIAYRKGGEAIGDGEKPVNDTQTEKAAVEVLDGKQVPFRILGANAVKFNALSAATLSGDWSNGNDWTSYYGGITADDSVFGSLAGTKVFDRVNHIATHNLFTSILDQFLKVYARTVDEATRALEKSFKEWDRHEPHFALFLAFLRLFEHARAETNTLTGRHLDFYYREILRLREKGAQPGHVHLLVELARQVESHEIKSGELFKAGKDDLGQDAFFASDREFVANQAKVTDLKTVYRHGDEKVGLKIPTGKHRGRFYASPIANSDDGLGAELTSVDQSWHPFYNKVYQDGLLSSIKMPEAEIGFAIASHYLLMAEGTRTVTVEFSVKSAGFAHRDEDEIKQKKSDSSSDRSLGAYKQTKEDEFPQKSPSRQSPFHNGDIVCLFSAKKGWIEIAASSFFTEGNTLTLEIKLSGEDPAVVPYSAKVHGYNYSTDLPMLLVKLRHQDTDEYIYPLLKDIETSTINLTVDVKGLKSLAVSNDFGPVDTSKPFQPYGPSPTSGNALIIGSKEIFQKTLTTATVGATWLASPVTYPASNSVTVDIDFLKDGQWTPSNIAAFSVGSTSYPLSNNLGKTVLDEPELTPNEFYSTASRHGFTRLVLANDFGQNTYQTDLLKYLRKDVTTDPGKPPAGPTMGTLCMDYNASQTITMDPADTDAFSERSARFFHLAPFGQAEQHPLLSSSKKVYLLPQFDFKRDTTSYETEAEFYIGVTGLKPPQNLALLFQVADGTADPLSKKPDNHINWSYLRGNDWIPFAKLDVEDRTGGLLNSGIVTLAVPRDASDTNTLLPSGKHWIRAAVTTESDAVCRLRMVATQALQATFRDKGIDPAFSAKVLQSGAISKLDQPAAAVKKVTQPFATFGGRGKEAPTAFYTRVSERLRHKDRSIALWDYERLVLEAFPQIFKVKCLNHTQYEPNERGTGIYKELAPGHVTIVTIPNQQYHNLRDPLRPFTSLGLLEEIDAFLHSRRSCFVKLHVTNPQFEEVMADFKVRLRDGFDETFHVNKLDEAITRFLSPWAFTASSSPTFGGKVYKSVLINFVEDLPYVDYVTDFKLFHRYQDSGGVQATAEKNEVEGSMAVSILVSAKKHNIEPFKPAEFETPPGEKCPCEA